MNTLLEGENKAHNQYFSYYSGGNKASTSTNVIGNVVGGGAQVVMSSNSQSNLYKPITSKTVVTSVPIKT